MNIGKPAAPQPASALSDGDELVGVALLLLFGDGNSLSAQLFHLALDGRLRSKGIEPAETGGLFGAGFIVWTTATTERNSLLRAVGQAIKEMGFWDRCEVAFFDKAEGYWRTIHPYGSAPFDRHLSQANINATRQQIHAEEETIQAIQVHLKSLAQAKQEGHQ